MSLTGNFVEEIERRILTGEWRSGDKIPPLRDLAQDFNVSRSVVNAGVVELQNKGYLVTVPRKYTMVADWKKSGTLAALSGIIANELYDREFFENILDCRMLIECAAVASAAKRRTDADLDELREVVYSEEHAVHIDARSAADISFHRAVAVASHNVVYPLILNFFEEMSTKFVTFFYQNNYDRQFVLEQHKIILKAVEDKASQLAESSMRLLLKQGEDVIKKLYLG